jgi:hypothetical protein
MPPDAFTISAIDAADYYFFLSVCRWRMPRNAAGR